MRKLEPLIIQDFRPGIHTNIEPNLAAPNILKYVINMYNDEGHAKAGTLKSRTGVTVLGGANDNIDQDVPTFIDPDDEIVGMWGGAETTGHRLLAAVKISGGNDVYVVKWDGSDWSDTGAVPDPFSNFTAITAALRFEYLSIPSGSSYIFASNGVEFKSWNGNPATSWGATNLSGIPSNVNLLRFYKGRLYVTGDIGYNKLYFSKLPDVATGLLPAWDPANDYILIGPGDTDYIKALEVSNGLLLIFKEHGMYTWDGVSTQTEPLYNVGAANQEVVKTIGSATIFFGQKNGELGVFRYEGGEPVDVSGPVRDLLKIENLASGDGIFNEFGAFADNYNYYLNIYDVTIDGIAYPNVLLIYNVKQNSWTIGSIKKPDGTKNNYFKFSATNLKSFGSASNIFTDLYSTYSLEEVVIGGTSLGTTQSSSMGIAPLVWNSTSSLDIYSDPTLGFSIDILVQTQALYWGSKSRKKLVNKFNVFADGNYGFVTVQMRVDGGDWESLGGLTNKKTTFEPGREGYEFEFRLIGSNTGEQFVFERIELFDVQVEDYEI